MKITTKARLREQLICMAQGATGGRISSSDWDLLPGAMGIEEWTRWVRAAKWIYRQETYDYVWEIQYLHQFGSLTEAVELLWEARK